jgi:nucleoside-diphosphate-sugar epimerase
MGTSDGVLLTGATGLLGRYLLRDLLLLGRKVCVLVRDDRARTARQRIDELVAFWSEQSGARLASPVVLVGDLTAKGLGLSAADRSCLSRSCRSVLHAAARVGFRTTRDGEPWQTNLEGVRRLVQLAASCGLDEFHHVSTAFVCGDRAGPVGEDELECGQGFHNDYERSKFAAERLLRRQGRLQVTVYRPSVIVGDSRTGYTSSFHGFYRFLDAADRLAEPANAGRRRLPLRLPFTGDESRNLVCVDWVAGAVTGILGKPNRHGWTYHLAARQPVCVRNLAEVGAELLGLEGLSWAGPDGPGDPTALEELFRGRLAEYWPYRRGDPAFLDDNTRAALPGLPPPGLDRRLLERLMRFALANGCGRGTNTASPTRGPAVDCSGYVERFFPEAVRRSSLAGVPLNLTVGLEAPGPGGGCWVLRWVEGELHSVRRARAALAEVAFRLDPATFSRIVTGRLSVREAFFAKRIEITGHVEKGLKLAVLFEQFVRESPYRAPPKQEARDAAGAY